MSERFKELPEKKQLSILRAAIEVFAKYEYKKASTDLIASKAGVSKGLLFYYFHNKKDLYLTVYEYVKRIIILLYILFTFHFQITRDFFSIGIKGAY